MATIPNNETHDRQEERRIYLRMKKQNWFKYRVGPGVPWLDPLTIQTIKEEMKVHDSIEGTVDYWVNEDWQRTFDERLSTATDTIKAAPYSPLPYAGQYEEYLNLKLSYDVEYSVSRQPDLDNDASFAGQRLSGANPLIIQKVEHIDDLPNTLAIKDGDGPRIKLQTAINERRLYICDYSDLGFLAGLGESMAPIFNGGFYLVDHPCQKYITAPIGLFYWEGDFSSEGRLLPYAIQLEQQAGAAVFTPKDSNISTQPENWRVAKAAFQAADALSHQWDSHLMRTHAVLAPFAISSERQLHPDHPVLRLMRPHLRYLLKVNSETGLLTDAGSYGDLLLAPNNDGLEDLLTQYYENYMGKGFYQMANLEKELAARKMTKEEAPISYPYRDDGMLIFKAIGDFVDAYLAVYYRGDDDVVGDYELQNFVMELTHEDCGGVKGLTENGDSIRSLEDLSDVLTNMIWTSGPAHAAVNYGQWDYMADMRNMPLSGYLEAPQDSSGPVLPNHAQFFPQYSLGKLQAGLMYVLGTYRLDRLGYYPPKNFDEIVNVKIVPDFQCALAHISAEIFEANKARSVSYPYLSPELVPNSTSI